MSNIQLRRGRPGDAGDLGVIAYEAFRTIAEKHNFPPDFPNSDIATGLMQMMLARPDIYSVVAENGQVVGSNFLWEGDEVDGVGPITIDPAAQNASVGRELMREVISRSDSNGKPTRLVQAAYHNRSLALYTKLGFDTVEPLSQISGPALNVKIDGISIRSMTPEDITAADKLCKEVHGISRKNEIGASVELTSGIVAVRNGRLTGYATVVGFFGHAVGETNDDLKALIGAGREYAGPGFLLPTRNNELMRWCLENGLRIIQPMTLMARGKYQEPKGAFLPSILY